MSIDTLVWLGCGEAALQGELNAKRLVLVEPRKNIIARLKQRFTATEAVQLVAAYIAPVASEATFYHYNLAEYSALSPVTGLKQLFPGIKLEQSDTVSTTAIDDFIISLNLDANQSHKLIIDIIDQALPLLEVLAASHLLDKFSQLQVQSASLALYQGAAEATTLIGFLASHGYDLNAGDNSDPDLPVLSFSRNSLWQPYQQVLEQKLQLEQTLAELKKQNANAVAEKETLQQQLSAAKVAAEKTQAELTGQLAGKDAELKQALQKLATAEQHLSSVNEQVTQQKQTFEQGEAELNKQLEQLKQQAGSDKQAFEQQKAVLTKENEAIRQQLSQVKAQHAELQAKHSELADKHTKLQQHSDHRIGELKTALAAAEQQLQQAAQQATLEKLLDDKLNALAAAKTEELNKAVGNIKNHVNTGLGNAAKQLEAFMGIQTYLEKGIKPLSFHGWPISPDIGLYLTGLIDANNYDVIIEFGSGTSTVLMAKALVSKQRGNAQKVLSDNSKAGTGLALGEADYNDLPARIVTFEHNSKYHAQTLKALQDNGVDGLVDLVHAPLVDYQYKDGSQYLYYSCADKLAELAKVFKGRKANILVLVDGPPGVTNKNARFPALPHLLNALSGHKFTIIMDDYKRVEEKEIIEKWMHISSDRFLAPVLEEIPSEKGLAVLEIE